MPLEEEFTFSHGANAVASFSSGAAIVDSSAKWVEDLNRV
eukprot:CAMPEP_0184556222 /NCGR_PEP_ID=MMETSP0199_2-20130426/39583_1 /TAXON_ID=1112570 /ORGANISM="Thraustochytrium sp., Strain LLF1b" /LENGTH=39 /DNA_ID= /DNA_START= /DNA_END= /DNA_ORIENTATION=